MKGLSFIPPQTTKGRGIALGTRKKTLHRRRRRKTKEIDATAFVGQELVDWTNEENKKPAAIPSSSNKKVPSKEISVISNDLDQKIRPPLLRHALALDTRVLQNSDNTPELEHKILTHYHSFIDTLVSRGATPISLLTTTFRDGQVALRTMPNRRATALRLEPLTSTDQGVIIPDELLAQSSWELLQCMSK